MGDGTASAPGSVTYRHHMFRRERRAAASGARRLAARGTGSQFLDQGLEAYGYFLAATIWGTAAGVIGVFVYLPTLIVGRGVNLASAIELVVVLALCLVAVVRVRQSKQVRIPCDCLAG